MNIDKDNLNVLIEQTLNLHGMDRVVELIASMLEEYYSNGYDEGFSDGYYECYATIEQANKEDYK